MENIATFVGLSHWAVAQIHLYHLQTTSYAEHKATDFWYDGIQPLLDEFFETYQGAMGTVITVSDEAHTFKQWTSKEDSIELISMFRSAVVEVKDELPEAATDLQNIADELIGLSNKTLYLLTLS